MIVAGHTPFVRSISELLSEEVYYLRHHAHVPPRGPRRTHFTVAVDTVFQLTALEFKALLA
jgi:hypothetical protein